MDRNDDPLFQQGFKNRIRILPDIDEKKIGLARKKLDPHFIPDRDRENRAPYESFSGFS